MPQARCLPTSKPSVHGAGFPFALILHFPSCLDSLRSLVGGVRQHVLYGCQGDEQPSPDSDRRYLPAPGGFIGSGLADPEEFPARRRDGEDVFVLFTAGTACPIGRVVLLRWNGWLCSGIHWAEYNILTDAIGSVNMTSPVKPSV